MRETMKIVFLVSSLSQPRCIKRILSFINAGYECEVYGYDRNKYNCNVLPSDVKVTVLGELNDGADYFNKLKTFRKDIKHIVKKHKNESPIYYSFGIISTVFFFLKRQKYIYEISDILYGYPRFSKVFGLLKAIDKRIIRKSVVTVMTSDGFREFFNLNLNNIVIQPNKLNRLLVPIKRVPLRLKDKEGLVFAFVGAIRYETIMRFAEVIGTHFPQHEFHFYGQASRKTMERCQSLSKAYSNVKYFGAFKNPEDLEEIYRKITIVVACYTPLSLNERLAEPNKLYESMFFCKPIIVSEGIFLSKQVEKYNCGYCIDATTEQSIISFVNNLQACEINSISEKESRINALELVDNPDEILKKVALFNKNR